MLILAGFHDCQGKDSEKLDSLKSSLKSNQEDTVRLKVLGDIARISWQLGQYDSTKVYTQKVFVNALPKIQSPKLQEGEYQVCHEVIASAYNSLGVVHILTGNIDSAEFYLLRSYHSYKKIANQSGMAKAYGNLGNIFKLHGQYDKAIQYYSQSLEIFKETEDKKAISVSNYNIGIVLQSWGKYLRALQYLQRSLKIAEEINDRSQMSRSLNAIGVIFVSQGNYPEALTYYLRSLRLSESNESIAGIYGVYSNLGTLYYYQGDFENAIAYHQRALENSELLKSKQGIASAHVNLGVTYAKLENFEEAFNHYSVAIELKKNMGDIKGVAIVESNLGGLLTRLAKNKDGQLSEDSVKQIFLSAYKHYSKALWLSDSLSIPNIKIKTLTGLGRTELGLGNSDKAIDFLLQAYELAHSLGKKGDLKNVYAVLSKVRESRGEYVSALDYYKLYTQMKDSLFNEDKSKDIGKLEARYEFEKGQDEQKRIKEAESHAEREAAQRRNNLQYSGITIFLILLVTSIMLGMSRIKSPQQGGRLPRAIGGWAIPNKILEGLIFLTFLLFFEFLLVLLDPQIEAYSGGEPAYKLLFNASIAALIFPLHALFERKLKGRLPM